MCGSSIRPVCLKGCEQDNMTANERMIEDANAAVEKYRGFEFAYQMLKDDEMEYLRERSRAYKKAVHNLQELILPVVNEECPSCKYGTCCRLYSSKLKIYIARSVGGFDFEDFLLARCDADFPEPDSANRARNFCAFWENGCRLDPDCRSLLCLQFFCEPLQRRLDMTEVNRRLAVVRDVVENFSLRRLFGHE